MRGHLMVGAAVLMILAVPCQSSSRSTYLSLPRAVQVIVNGSPVYGNIPSGLPSPGYAGHLQVLYVAEVWAGSYTLGMTLPPGRQEVNVSLLTGPPYAIGSRRIRLPMGPAVVSSTHPRDIFWTIGISPESSGSSLYILTESSASGGKGALFPHRIFLVSPPVEAIHTQASGITFLQGPRNLLLIAEAIVPPRIESATDPAVSLPQIPFITGEEK